MKNSWLKTFVAELGSSINIAEERNRKVTLKISRMQSRESSENYKLGMGKWKTGLSYSSEFQKEIIKSTKKEIFSEYEEEFYTVNQRY